MSQPTLHLLAGRQSGREAAVNKSGSAAQHSDATTGTAATATGTTASGATVLRLRPVPPLEPPYDDIDEEPARPALQLLPGGRQLIDAPAPTLPFDDIDTHEPDVGFAAQLTPRSELPDPHRWTATLVRAVTEVLAGRRPLQQLMPWTNERVYLQITGRLRRRRTPSVPPQVLSVYVTEPSDGVVEACAVLRHGARNQAVALRLEGADGRWRCTAWQLG